VYRPGPQTAATQHQSWQVLLLLLLLPPLLLVLLARPAAVPGPPTQPPLLPLAAQAAGQRPRHHQLQSSHQQPLLLLQPCQSQPGWGLLQEVQPCQQGLLAGALQPQPSRLLVAAWQALLLEPTARAAAVAASHPQHHPTGWGPWEAQAAAAAAGWTPVLHWTKEGTRCLRTAQTSHWPPCSPE